MKKLMILLLLSLLLSSCKYFKGDNCNNTSSIIGTYENVYDRKAKNILIIKADGTFEQIFKKEELLKNNFGKWEFIKENCNIYLIDLKLLHELPQQNKNLFYEKGIYRLNNIVFVEGMSYEFNYYKIEEE